MSVGVVRALSAMASYSLRSLWEHIFLVNILYYSFTYFTHSPNTDVPVDVSCSSVCFVDVGNHVRYWTLTVG